MDSLKLGRLIGGYYPREWSAIKNRWDEIYPTVPLYVNTEVTLNGLGEHH